MPKSFLTRKHIQYNISIWENTSISRSCGRNLATLRVDFGIQHDPRPSRSFPRFNWATSSAHGVQRAGALWGKRPSWSHEGNFVCSFSWGIAVRNSKMGTSVHPKHAQIPAKIFPPWPVLMNSHTVTQHLFAQTTSNCHNCSSLNPFHIVSLN